MRVGLAGQQRAAVGCDHHAVRVRQPVGDAYMRSVRVHQPDLVFLGADAAVHVDVGTPVGTDDHVVEADVPLLRHIYDNVLAGCVDPHNARGARQPTVHLPGQRGDEQAAVGQPTQPRRTIDRHLEAKLTVVTNAVDVPVEDVREPEPTVAPPRTLSHHEATGDDRRRQRLRPALTHTASRMSPLYGTSSTS